MNFWSTALEKWGKRNTLSCCMNILQSKPWLPWSSDSQ